MAHGVAVNQLLTSKMTPDQEREYIRHSVDSVAKATGTTPRGWMGAEFGESAETAAILADEGVSYVCDWPNDDQPYPMKTPTGDLYSMPVNLTLVDVRSHWYGRIQVDTYAKMIMDSFDVVYREGAETGRMLVLNFPALAHGHRVPQQVPGHGPGPHLQARRYLESLRRRDRRLPPESGRDHCVGAVREPPVPSSIGASLVGAHLTKSTYNKRGENLGRLRAWHRSTTPELL